jgi:tetratricopeptide (TPR) repeat protein
MNRTVVVGSCLVLLTGILFAQSQLEDGKALFRDKKYREAVQSFHVATQLYPREPQGWYWLAKSFSALGIADSTEISAARSKQLDDDNLDVYILLSNAQLKLKKNADAYATVRAGLKIKKNHPAFVAQLAIVQLNMDSVDAAIRTATLSKELGPTNPTNYEVLGDAYAKQGLTQIALSQYEKSLELDSSQSSLMEKMATAYQKERRYPEAVKMYQLVIAMGPENQVARFELGRIYYRAKRFREAAKIFNEFYAREKNNKEARAMYIESMYQSRQFKEAVPILEESIKTPDASKKWFRYLARGYFELKKFDSSAALYQRVKTAGKDTLDADDFRLWARAQQELKRFDAAAASYEESLKLDSTQLPLFGDVGALYMQLKNWERAAYWFERRFNSDSTAISAYVNYSACMLQLERFEKAVTALEKTISQNPQYVPAYTRLGVSYLRLKDYTKSRAAFELAIKIIDTAESKYKADLGMANRYIGLVFLLEKKYKEGLDNLLKSTQYDDTDCQTYVWIGQAHQNLQKKEDALRAYNKALKLCPDNKDAKQGKEVLEQLNKQQ